MKGALSRRGLMVGLAALPLAARAEGPGWSPRPPRRPGAVDAQPEDISARADEIIAAAKLGGQVTFALADMRTGALIAARGAGLAMPPASTLKTITSLYALEHLGAGYRFATRLMATGPIGADGRIDGDLILAGGGDPVLDTDDLGDLAALLAEAGVRSVAGRFCVWGGALPYQERLDPTQPDWVDYNPALGGLNLNFNRVNFTWERGGDSYHLAFDARAERFAPEVTGARMRLADRERPLFTYDGPGEGAGDWTVARAALGGGGSRWLPVRRPDLYAGEVFRTLAAAQGIALAGPEPIAALPAGARAISTHNSPALADLLRGMMKYSTNMTAETVGMAATAARGIGGDHAASAGAMEGWFAGRMAGTTARFADHSGLGGGSRICAADMAAALVRLGPAAGLAGLMKSVKFKDASDLGAKRAPQGAVAKTGTLNFVSGLVGYFTTAAGEGRAFAIYAADPERRDAIPVDSREDPPGMSAWVRRARRMELQLLGAWA